MKSFVIHSSNRDWTIEKPSQETIFTEYRNAIQQKDMETAEKLRALFQLSVLEKDLVLTNGDEMIPQLGGIHRQIKGKIPGFESHHIPAQSIQEEKADLLPAIAISAEDHKLTDSYAGKAHSRFKSFLPDVPRENTYKSDAASMIENDQYIELVRLELFNIRDRCGNKYDGAIRGYIDALTDYIVDNGTPEVREPKRGKEQDQMENISMETDNGLAFQSDCEATGETGNGSAKTLKHVISTPSFTSRGEDTMTLLDNYRENLRNRGVSETQIERFLADERDKIQREYNDRDQNKEDPYIYHDPQDWNAIAASLKKNEEAKEETAQPTTFFDRDGWSFNMEPSDANKAVEGRLNFDMKPVEVLNQGEQNLNDPSLQNEQNRGMTR